MMVIWAEIWRVHVLPQIGDLTNADSLKIVATSEI